jgi:SAM (Sterile alpha motif) domain-containing protein
MTRTDRSISATLDSLSGLGDYQARSNPGTDMDVGGWLRGLGLEHYEAAFRENQIDDTVLRTLKADDLRELGVGSVGHRRKLLHAIAALPAEASAPPPLSEPHLATDKSAAPVQQLDLATVIKVSQAVWSEIVLDRLADTVMRLAVEQASAERGLLFFAKTEGLRVVAEATTGGDIVTVRLCNDRVAGGRDARIDSQSCSIDARNHRSG